MPLSHVPVLLSSLSLPCICCCKSSRWLDALQRLAHWRLNLTYSRPYGAIFRSISVHGCHHWQILYATHCEPLLIQYHKELFGSTNTKHAAIYAKTALHWFAGGSAADGTAVAQACKRHAWQHDIANEQGEADGAKMVAGRVTMMLQQWGNTLGILTAASR